MGYNISVTDRAIDDSPPPAESVPVTPCLSSLAGFRRQLADLLAGSVPEHRWPTFLVAINEAVTNAIEAHQRRGSNDPVMVTVDPDQQLVSVEDRGGGPPDRPATWPPPNSLGGRGLLIMHSFCPGLRMIATELGSRLEFPYPTDDDGTESPARR